MPVAKARNFDAYKDTEIGTASQAKLIVMLYDGAIRFLGIALENLTPPRYDVANTNIIKSQDIVTELMLSLNMDEGGEISNNLFNIYVYLKKRLLEGNIAKDAAILKECMTLLEDLRDAWEQVQQKESRKPTLANREAASGSFSIEG